MTTIESTATELEPTPSTAILAPVGTIDDGRAQMQRFQAECAAVLSPSDWQGTPGKRGSFVKKSGWRKLAMRYAISCRITSRTVERDEHGNPVRAEAAVLAIHKATGQEQEADGYCSVTEPRFAREQGRYKVENDLRNTATTRAKNRAISDLIGYGQVDAENAGPADEAEPEQPYGPPASDNDLAGLGRAVLGLYRDPETGEAMVDSVLPLIAKLREEAGGYVPKIVAYAVMYTAAHNPHDQSTVRPADTGTPDGTDGDGEKGEDATPDGGEAYVQTDAAIDDPPDGGENGSSADTDPS